MLKYIKVLYQDVRDHVKEFWESQADEQQKESARKESLDRSTALSASDQLLSHQQLGSDRFQDPSKVLP